MLGRRDSFRVARPIGAACLALLLSLASLAPLAAQSLSASNSSCCRRSQAKCCHHKGNAEQPLGPTLSSTSCDSDCGRLTLGGIGPSGFVRPSTRSVAPPNASLSGLRVSDSSSGSHFFGHALQQSPPPDTPLV